MSRRLCAALAAVSLSLLSSTASGAFRTLEDYSDVPDGARVRWPEGVFEYWIYERGIDSVSAEELAGASRRAFASWALAPCARIAPSHVGMSPFPAEPDDGMNTIEIVEENWEDLGFPIDAAGANDILFGEAEDGSWVILEADIYINAQHHLWSTADPPGSDERSLLGVLTHEAGHALGLLHPCEPDGEDEAPSCDPDDLPGDLMSPYYASDQLHPESEDWGALCYLYPACETNSDCELGSTCQESQCVPLDADGDGVCEGLGSEDDAPSDICPPETRPTGEQCSESNQCEGGECVAGVENVPVCTQRCGEGQPACPRNWACTEVEHRKVCLPPNEEPGCDCVISRTKRSPSGTAWGLLVAGGALASLFRRRARRARSDFSETES